jgi:WD40 repeat protein
MITAKSDFPSPAQIWILGIPPANYFFPRMTNSFWQWESGKLLKKFNQTGKKIESVSWHPNGQYIAHAGHDSYIYIYRVAEILEYSNDDIPVAHKSWSGDYAEYIDFNADGSFLTGAHQNGLIKLWVWMCEDPALKDKRHEWVKTQQKDAQK